ncbi:PREDICTED: probable 39S ribosomal protein L49, mitochondrial [Polistes dominula]|uniref:Large ribosomal subunit protein mL49 n=1 Tax=Polistes dominula TaxID=743375 RepID=A0ABM1II90_POLDO|nr:PREDICTED: probable 39S ribosomal protein L49, mitochondrial [Polistes dominula]
MAALRIFTRSCFSPIFHASTALQSMKHTFPTITEISKRWSSYKSSPIYKDPSHYTDYEISTDPVEWDYVKRLMKNKVIPKPTSTDQNLPSGWKPATAKPNDYPYFIQRTKNHMLPIYLARSFRGMRRITHVRKIQGDIWKLEEELKKHIEETKKRTVGSRVNEMVGEIKFRGDFVSCVKQWFLDKGF